MNVIFKYQMPIQEKFDLKLPKDAKIIRVDDVDGMFYLWAIVDTEKEPEIRHFECYKTGHPILTPLDDLVYIGFCTLFIMQELCLYIFENTVKHEV